MKTAISPRPRPAQLTFGELGDRTLAKVRRRIIPVICILYFVAFLDRNNVGFAKLTMSEDIGLTAAGYGLGAGIFFIGYALFEIPSNGGMYRFGARKWIARILISWGICATAMALVNGETILLRHPLSARSRRSRLLPRRRLLPHPVVPGRPAGHRARAVHSGPAHLQRHRRTRVGPASEPGRDDGTPGVAVALHH